MFSGKLRHRVDIQQPPATVGTRGQRSGDWVTLYESVPASVDDLQGLELIRAQKLVAEATIQIKIRYHAGLDTSCRMIFGARTFNILHINNVQQRNRELIILANEVR